MDSVWEVLAQKYLGNVFFRRQTDAAASRGDRHALCVITTAAAIAK